MKQDKIFSNLMLKRLLFGLRYINFTSFFINELFVLLVVCRTKSSFNTFFDDDFSSSARWLYWHHQNSGTSPILYSFFSLLFSWGNTNRVELNECNYDGEYLWLDYSWVKVMFWMFMNCWCIAQNQNHAINVLGFHHQFQKLVIVVLPSL